MPSEPLLDLRTLHRRIDVLERHNRRLRAGSVAAGLLAAVFVWMGQAKDDAPKEAPPAITNTTRLYVHNPETKTAALIGQSENAFGLFLHDKAGNKRAALYLDDDGTPHLEYFNEAGKPIQVTPRHTAAARTHIRASRTADEGDDKAASRGNEADTITVYVTQYGTKYHRQGCSSLRKSAIPMPLSEAAKRYEPCSRCKPPIP